MTVEEEMKLAEDDKGTARGETRVEPWTTNRHHEQYQHHLGERKRGDHQTCQKFQLKMPYELSIHRLYEEKKKEEERATNHVDSPWVHEPIPAHEKAH